VHFSSREKVRFKMRERDKERGAERIKEQRGEGRHTHANPSKFTLHLTPNY